MHGGPRRHNPLYDTPPAQRHLMMQQQQQQQQQQPFVRPSAIQMSEIRGFMGNASPLMNHHQMGLNMPRGQKQMLTEPVLSPILTDNEVSPLHRTGLGASGNL